MKLKKGSFQDFAQKVQGTGKGIIVYGAGVIGQAAAPYWLHTYSLDDKVICYVDADPHKQGQVIEVGARSVLIKDLNALTENCGAYILLVTASAFEPIVQALERIPALVDVETYFLPVMLLDAAHTPKKGGVVKTSDTQLIPKKLHYCWFSGNPIPPELQKCIDTWSRFCPDYEIIRWDESNYDVNKNEYMRQAHSRGKWGFVSDVARWDILYHHGGVYLDTDVELIRTLDDLLYQPAFCGFEKWGIVNSGGGCGSKPENPVIKALLDYRLEQSFLYGDGTQNVISSGYFESVLLSKFGLLPNGETQVIANGMMTVYASEFFQPFDYISGENRSTYHTFTIHHFSGTWLGPEAAEERKKTMERYQVFVTKLEY